MPRLLDLVRASAVSSHQMMSAAKGGLRVSPVETLEILVHLAEHNKIFGEQARLTLAGWDESACKELAANPKTPREVLDYWLSPKNIRPVLFPILLENPSVPVTQLAELASALQGELIDVMIASPRIRNSVQVLNDLSANHNLSGTQVARVQALINGTVYVQEVKLAPAAVASIVEPAGAASTDPSPAEAATSASVADAPTTSEAPPTSTTEEVPVAPEPGDAPDHSSDPETEKVVVAFLTEHAAAIAAEPQKPFQPIGGLHEEEVAAEQPKTVAAAASAATVAAVHPTPAPVPKSIPHKKSLGNPQDEQRGSVLQKIAKLDVKGRIQLAMKGTKEERSILVRDGTKIVAIAVLESPKVTDGEVEKFATQKNVLEGVLRAIPMKRRFAKHYAILRNLVFNPRTPLDVALALLKNLLIADLRNLAGNKEVSETVSKLALRMFKQKSERATKE